MKMTNSEFISQLKMAGIGGMYHSTDLSITRWISEKSNLYELLSDRDNVKRFLDQGKHLILDDKTGVGFHVASMICRGILRYGITARMANPFRMGQSFRGGDTPGRIALDGIDLLILSPFDSMDQDPPENIGLVEWILREHISDGGSIIISIESEDWLHTKSWWSKSFRQMIQNSSLRFTV